MSGLGLNKKIKNKLMADETVGGDWVHVTDQQGIPLTKREYFAALAMAALVSKYNLNQPVDQDIVATLAVELSESLIFALNNVGAGKTGKGVEGNSAASY
jgi:hypothetical protein